MSAYLGRRGLEQLREGLSERDLAVVTSVYEHRFLTARQIEALHFDDHATAEAAARICRRVLARLTRERLLARLRRRSRRGPSRVGVVRVRASGRSAAAWSPTGAAASPSRRRSFSITRSPSPRRASNYSARPARGSLSSLRSRSNRLAGAATWGREAPPSSSGPTSTWSRRAAPTRTAGSWRSTAAPRARRPSPASAAPMTATGEPAPNSRGTGRSRLVVWVAPDERRAERIKKVISGMRNLRRDLFRVTTASGLVALVAGGTQ